MSSNNQRYPQEMMRPGIVPGVLGTIAVLAGLWLFDTEWFFAVRVAVAILAAILVVMCFQGRRPLTMVFAVLLAVIVVIWNPVVDLTGVFRGAASQVWMFVELAAAATVLWAGMVIRVPLTKGR